MANEETAEATWLPVIGKALAYLCLKAAEQEGKFKTTLDRVDFLEALGLSSADAATAVGSTKASVNELRRRGRNKKGRRNGVKKKKTRR